MQEAYQDFLLHGSSNSNKKKKKKHKSHSAAASSSSSSPNPPTPRQPKTTPSSTKMSTPLSVSSPRETPRGTGASPQQQQQLQQQHRKVFAKLRQDWKDMDDNLYALISSVVDLRRRLWFTSQALQRDKEENDLSFHGRRFQHHKNSPLWTRDDLQLALHHCLRQHEQRLQQIRSLLTSQASILDTASRRLEHSMTLQVNEDPITGMSGTSDENDDNEDDVQIYRNLSLEGYRKQKLVQTLLLDSTHDGLLVQQEPNNTTDESSSTTPLQCAELCLKQWTAVSGK